MPMKDIYRRPQVEEGKHNIVLQNRCGNRLTALFHEDSVELEFVYKPNAFRRKEFRARNFSNRDNFTALFRDARLPEIGASFVQRFHYDPFLTRVETQSPGGARNCISFLNVADENAFGLAAECPLLITLTPHGAFAVEDGLLYEEFCDRGEEIVSFVAFGGLEQNRYRVLQDGRHVLQLMEGDVLLIGGEESLGQVRRAVGRLRGMSPSDLAAHTERQIAPAISRAQISLANADIQRVADLNRRIVWSGIDEGGACFGALNRIYHLIWVRDGAMAASTMAHAGNPEVIKRWAPLVLDNPTWRTLRGGRSAPEFLQMVGTRWTKSEDDGLYYAVLTLFSLYQATADDTYLRNEWLETLLRAAEHHIGTRWDGELCLMGSDTVGETTLAGSRLYGYDAVNGSMAAPHRQAPAGPQMARCHTLYHNMNTYNVMRMLEALLGEAGPGWERWAEWCRLWGDRLEDAISSRFVDPTDGVYLASHAIYADGSQRWLRFEDGDQWEYCWAVTCGPFFPCLETALRSARHVREAWPKVRPYGYCPWNMLARMLREFGMPTEEFSAMLADEVSEALALTERYPMQGALTEYWHNPNGWRALPFSAGTFLNTLCSLVLRGLPAGVAVRASPLAHEVSNFAFRSSRIDAEATGEGDSVRAVSVNGVPLEGTLQIPEAMLRAGRNCVRIQRGAPPAGPRLFSSDARLLAVERASGQVRYHMSSPTRADLVFEGLRDAASARADSPEGPLEFRARPLAGTAMTVLTVRGRGDFTVTVRL